MTNVLAFPTPEVNAFAEAWSLITPQMRKRSEAKDKVKRLWDQEAKRLYGQADLLERLRSYLKTDKDLPRSGGPALNRLLTSGRLEHYEPLEALCEEPGMSGERFPNEAVRNALLRRCGPEWVASYLDPCSIDGTSIVTRTDYAARKLLEHRQVFKMAGFTGIKKRV